MLQKIGLIFIVMGSINLALFFLWSLMTWRNLIGARLSKKIGRDNANTGDAIVLSEGFKKKLSSKLVTSTTLIFGGAAMYYIMA